MTTGRAKTFSLARKIVFSAITILLLFALIEGGLRLFGFSFKPSYSIHAQGRWASHGVQQDPTLPWSWTPIPGALCHIDGRVDFHFNQLGYRGALFQKEKARDSLRIVCMGDSGTMGWGVRDGDMYCSQVQSILEAKCGKKVETINAGVFGYTSFQGLHQLKNKIIELHPDIITICYNWNDHAAAIRIASLSGKEAWEKGVPTTDKALYRPQAYSGLVQLFSNSRIFQLLQYAALNVASLSDSKQVEEKSDSDAELLRVPLEDYKNNLEKIIQTARENGITPILLTQSFNPKKVDMPEVNIHYKRQQLYNDAIREVAAKTKVICVDPTTVLETNSKFFNSNTHPTKAGHNRIAMLLAREIARQNCGLQE